MIHTSIIDCILKNKFMYLCIYNQKYKHGGCLYTEGWYSNDVWDEKKLPLAVSHGIWGVSS
jgi:hypothetical protein